MADDLYDDDERDALHSREKRIEISDLLEEDSETSTSAPVDESSSATETDTLTNPNEDDEEEELSEAEYQERMRDRHEEYISGVVDALHDGECTVNVGAAPMADRESPGICTVTIDNQQLYVVYTTQGGFVYLHRLSVDRPFSLERYLPNEESITEYLDANSKDLSDKSTAITEWLRRDVRRSIVSTFDENGAVKITSTRGSRDVASVLRVRCQIFDPDNAEIKSFDSKKGEKLLKNSHWRYEDHYTGMGLTVEIPISCSGYSDQLRNDVGAPDDVDVPDLDWSTGRSKSFNKKREEDQADGLF